MNTSFADIKSLFEPQTIAVIGASHDETKYGNRIVKNIIAGGYRGRVYPVNPSGGALHDLKVYASLDEIKGAIETALICLPAASVFDTVDACIRRGIRHAVVIASGFSEIGNSAEEKRIATHARQHGLRLLGPNVFGFYSAASSLNATFTRLPNPGGGVAVLTQSGPLGLAMIGRTAMEHIGLSAVVSTGNKADIDEADLLRYLIQDESTKVILIYLEAIREGSKLVRCLGEATRLKPVVMLKAGKSERGAMAAISHTGLLAGSDEVFDDLVRQCGAIRAETIDDAFAWCSFMASSGVPRDENAVIITNGGGMGVLATDYCEKYGVKLYPDNNELRKTFAAINMNGGSIKNPVDISNRAGVNEYEEALNAALTSENIHAVIALYNESELLPADDLVSMIQKVHMKYRSIGKPVVFSLFGGHDTAKCVDRLKSKRVPAFVEIDRTVSSMGALYRYYRFRNEFSAEPDVADVNSEEIDRLIEKARRAGRNFLMSYEAGRVMEIIGVPAPRGIVAQNIVEAIVAAEKIGYPVVMKVISRDILHKSDSGGVALNLENKNEIIDAYQAIIQNCKTTNPDVHIEGVEISEMAPPGIEMIIGARVDAVFGPIIMCGLGGVHVEIMKDVAFRSLPVSRKEAMNMIKDVRSYPLLLGVRSEGSRDIEEVVNTVIKLGSLILARDDIRDVEINPLVVNEHGKGVIALDVRIILTPT